MWLQQNEQSEKCQVAEGRGWVRKGLINPISAGGTPQKERGSGNSLSKAEGSRGGCPPTQSLGERETIRHDRDSV